jgi:hypothetical protein
MATTPSSTATGGGDGGAGGAGGAAGYKILNSKLELHRIGYSLQLVGVEAEAGEEEEAALPLRALPVLRASL